VSTAEEPLLLELNSALVDAGLTPPEETSSGTEEVEPAFLSSQPRSRRIAFLFDSTLTAFLMMGNLSPVSIIFCFNLYSNSSGLRRILFTLFIYLFIFILCLFYHVNCLL
jgi:hypothetical protein